ncbi:MAG: hypothetical protein KIS97_05015 [Nitrospira sp.]|nr:hypothetical protein [Nitrospira sp.]
MKHRLGITIAVLHISAFVNVVLALGLLAMGSGDPDVARVLGPAPAGFLAACCIAFAVGVETTVW